MMTPAERLAHALSASTGRHFDSDGVLLVVAREGCALRDAELSPGGHWRTCQTVAAGLMPEAHLARAGNDLHAALKFAHLTLRKAR